VRAGTNIDPNIKQDAVTLKVEKDKGLWQR
jgi:hypothetical protein